MMKLILLQDVKGQGKKGDLVEVSEGYGRNFLLPRNLAKKADNQGISEIKAKAEAKKHHINEEIENGNELKAQIESITVEVTAKAGESGKLFGTVTSMEIANALKEKHSIEIDKRKIVLKESLKSCGEYTAQVKVYTDIVAALKIKIISE